MAEHKSEDEITQQLLEDLRILRQSQPTAAAHQNYRQLFDQVQQKSGGRISQWLQSLSANLAWDSRQQGATAGARAPSSPYGGLIKRDEYRLLYVTDRAEIEMMVMPEPSSCHIEGDLIPLSQSVSGEVGLTPALISLQTPGSAIAIVETETDQDGRFRLESVAPGRYSMHVILQDGILITVDSLSLT